MNSAYPITDHTFDVVVVALTIVIAVGVFAWAYTVRMGGATP